MSNDLEKEAGQVRGQLAGGRSLPKRTLVNDLKRRKEICRRERMKMEKKL